MFYYLYEIRNNLDGKVYIGVHKTKNLDDGYMGSGKVLRRAINKHGIENFSKTILEYFTSSEEMYSREKEVVTEEFLNQNNTYNLRLGGFGGFDYINSSSEIKEKRIKYFGEQNSFFGKTHSAETKRKLAELARIQWSGVPKSEEHKDKIRTANLGVKFSLDRCKKISAARKGQTAHNKGIKYPVVECPHCGKLGGGPNMNRWHFDNCKATE